MQSKELLPLKRQYPTTRISRSSETSWGCRMQGELSATSNVARQTGDRVRFLALCFALFPALLTFNMAIVHCWAVRCHDGLTQKVMALTTSQVKPKMQVQRINHSAGTLCKVAQDLNELNTLKELTTSQGQHSCIVGALQLCQLSALLSNRLLQTKQKALPACTSRALRQHTRVAHEAIAKSQLFHDLQDLQERMKDLELKNR